MKKEKHFPIFTIHWVSLGVAVKDRYKDFLPLDTVG